MYFVVAIFLSYSGNLIEKKIFISHYRKLVNILPVENILHELVTVEIISPGDVEEINHMPRSRAKASFILNKIDSSLEAGYKDNFYTLLDIMEGCCNDDVREAVIDIRSALMTGELIVNFDCTSSYTSKTTYRRKTIILYSQKCVGHHGNNTSYSLHCLVIRTTI